jgi:hypothetical protein
MPLTQLLQQLTAVDLFELLGFRVAGHQGCTVVLCGSPMSCLAR